METTLDNPFNILMELGTPYEDYINKINTTYNFKYYSKFIYEAKAINWDLDGNFIKLNQIRIIYASLLELMIEDDTPETFFNIFPEYIKMVIERNPSAIFRDGHMNSIFHYDAVQGGNRPSAYEKIQNRFNDSVKLEIGIDTDIFKISLLEDQNTQGVTILDILNANS